jgi:hypothetical protein
MDSDKLIQHYILEELNNQLERQRNWDKSKDKPPAPVATLHISELQSKLSSKGYNITMIRTNYVRLMNRGLVLQVDVLVEMSYLLITKTGILAYASQELIQEHEAEENANKHLKASILASEATERLAKNQIQFNNKIKRLTYIATCLVVVQSVFMFLQYKETQKQTKILQQQLENQILNK